MSCGPVLAAIGSMPDYTVRLWMQAVIGQYTTTALLHKMFPLKYPTATCPWCQLGVPETLGHFLPMCSRFREARTEVLNRYWRAIMRIKHDHPMGRDHPFPSGASELRKRNNKCNSI